MDFFLASFFSGLFGFFLKGGIFLLFLLALSVCALTVIILRAIALRQADVLPEALCNEIERLEPGEGLEKLQALIPRHPSPLSRVLGTLIKHLTWPRSEVIEAVQTRARHEIAGME